MNGRAIAFLAALGLTIGFASPAFADDVSDLRAELEAMKRKMDAQERQLRGMEGSSLSRDEISAAVGKYLDAGPAPAVLVGGGGGADGSAGFPLGKKPYIKEGPNKIEFAFRNQVRYSAFLYSDDAKGVVFGQADADPAEESILSDAAPRDRSGFEIERLYFGLDGTVFCESITFKLELNFDSDSSASLEKRYAYLDWKYSGEHHVRAGGDKVAYSYDENNSSGALAFVDRSIVTKAFELGFDTGVSLWGYLGGCDCPKNFMYKFQISNGEGAISRGSVFNTDARDTYADNLLFAGMFEWNITCNDWKYDQVDNRPCDKRCKLDASVGIAAYYESDDDFRRDQWGGLAVRSSDKAKRYGLDAWFRMQWNGLSVVAEAYLRNLEFTETSSGADSSAEEQEDTGVCVMAHYRFADTNWGVGVRGGMIWLDDDYLSINVDSGGPVEIEDAITEYGVVLNYFFYDHNNKISLDANWVQDNSGVNSTSAGYMSSVSRGIVVEDGIMLRLQWQLSL